MHNDMKSRALVLRTVKYNDEAFIAHLFTEQEGRVAMLVRINRSKRAAVRHTLFQPLAVLEVEWENRPNASLQRPKQAVTALPLLSLPYDPHKSAMTLFLAEFLFYALQGETDKEALFDYVARSVEWLDTCPKGYANFHLVFLLRLTHFLGFMPQIVKAREGHYFDLRSSCFVPVQPIHPDFLPPREAALLPKLLRMRYDNMHVFRFSGTERSQLLEHLNHYYRLHLPGFPELKSLAVLKMLF